MCLNVYKYIVSAPLILFTVYVRGINSLFWFYSITHVFCLWNNCYVDFGNYVSDTINYINR